MSDVFQSLTSSGGGLGAFFGCCVVLVTAAVAVEFCASLSLPLASSSRHTIGVGDYMTYKLQQKHISVNYKYVSKNKFIESHAD